MGKIERLIEAYETWDLDSLVDEAYNLSCIVRDDVASNCHDVRDPLVAALMIGCYFMDADGFVDGDENSMYMRLFRHAPISESGDVWYRDYKRYNWEPWVINYLRNCSSTCLEHALVFGIIICAADGFITERERERILRWA